LISDKSWIPFCCNSAHLVVDLRRSSRASVHCPRTTENKRARKLLKASSLSLYFLRFNFQRSKATASLPIGSVGASGMVSSRLFTASTNSAVYLVYSRPTQFMISLVVLEYCSLSPSPVRSYTWPFNVGSRPMKADLVDPAEPCCDRAFRPRLRLRPPPPLPPEGGPDPARSGTGALLLLSLMSTNQQTQMRSSHYTGAQFPYHNGMVTIFDFQRSKTSMLPCLGSFTQTSARSTD